MNHQDRRESDHKRLAIEQMIQAEGDPKQRSFLIVLNSINESLVANTRTTQDVALKLDKHLTAFELSTAQEAERRNRQAGMARIGVYVLGVVQVILVGSVGFLVQELKELRQTDSELRQIAVKNATRLDGHDIHFKSLERKP